MFGAQKTTDQVEASEDDQSSAVWTTAVRTSSHDGPGGSGASALLTPRL